MSINTLLSNESILNALVDIIDEKSGNVASVSGSTYIEVAPTAGNVVVTLNLPECETNNFVLASTTEGVLSWVANSDTGIQSVTAVTKPDATASLLTATTSGNAVSIDLNVPTLPSENGMVLASSTEGVLSWVGNADTGLQSVSAITRQDATSSFLTATTSSNAVSIDLNVPGLPSNDGMVLSSTTTGELSWVIDNGGIANVIPFVPSEPAGAVAYLTADTLSGVVAIGLNVPSLPASDGMVLASSTLGALSWVSNAEGAVTAVEAGNLVTCSTTAGVVTVSLPVSGTATVGDVISMGSTGLEWITPPADAVTAVEAGELVTCSTTAGVVTVSLPVSGTATVGDVISMGSTGLEWVANDNGVQSLTSGNSYIEIGGTPANPTVGLDVILPTVNGYVLSSTTEGVLSWVAGGPGSGNYVSSSQSIIFNIAQMGTDNPMTVTSVTATVNSFKMGNSVFCNVMFPLTMTTAISLTPAGQILTLTSTSNLTYPPTAAFSVQGGGNGSDGNSFNGTWGVTPSGELAFNGYLPFIIDNVNITLPFPNFMYVTA